MRVTGSQVDTLTVARRQPGPAGEAHTGIDLFHASDWGEAAAEDHHRRSHAAEKSGSHLDLFLAVQVSTAGGTHPKTVSQRPRVQPLAWAALERSRSVSGKKRVSAGERLWFLPARALLKSPPPGFARRSPIDRRIEVESKTGETTTTNLRLSFSTAATPLLRGERCATGSAPPAVPAPSSAKPQASLATGARKKAVAAWQ